MPKKSVNLILPLEKDKPVVKKLKIILPVVAVISLLTFTIVFLASIFYINSNIFQFNLLKSEIDQLENNIGSQKNTEGIYTLTSSRLNILDQVSGKSANFTSLIGAINQMNLSGISITNMASDNKGNVTFSVAASSSASMDSLVSYLLDKDKKKIFSKIEAHGIVREKTGSYTLTITLLANNSLLK